MSGMTIKRCCRCQQNKPVEQFFHSRTVKDGFRSRCKECEKGYPVISRDEWRTRTEKRCAGCGETKKIDYFYLCNGRPNSHCKRCHNRMTMKNYHERTEEQRAQYNQNRREHPKISQRRRNELLRRYGITEEEFIIQLERQGGFCAICQKVLEPACIDHCHRQGHVRGLLCKWCNAGLGSFQDDIQALQRAIEYLQTQGVWYAMV